MSIADADRARLRAAALAAQANAYAPYSGVHVGAALLDDEGRVHAGCNVENASYGATLCGEAGAMLAAVAAGARRFVAGFVTGDVANCFPCGICRQRLAEFGVPFVIVRDMDGREDDHLLTDLLPHAFELDPDRQ